MALGEGLCCNADVDPCAPLQSQASLCSIKVAVACICHHQEAFMVVTVQVLPSRTLFFFLLFPLSTLTMWFCLAQPPYRLSRASWFSCLPSHSPMTPPCPSPPSPTHHPSCPNRAYNASLFCEGYFPCLLPSGRFFSPRESLPALEPDVSILLRT